MDGGFERPDRIITLLAFSPSTAHCVSNNVSRLEVHKFDAQDIGNESWCECMTR